MSGLDDSTPLMKQYWELKARPQAQGALLFFRMGDFYELFAEDAVEAARLLEITLTSRDKGKANPMPMAGVPHHSASSYIQRLLKAGKKVAIAEQFEEMAAKGSGKTIVRREITRVFTPAVQFDHESSEAAYLATAIPQGENHWVLACLDPSTGETRTSGALTPEELLTEFQMLPIRHLLRIAHHLPEQVIKAVPASSAVLIEDLPSHYHPAPEAAQTLKLHYGLESLEAFISEPSGIHALGLLVAYVLRTQQQDRLPHLRLPLPLHRPKALVLGPRTAQHLDLLPSPDGTPNLFQFINRTRSAIGARQLRKWLLEPLSLPEEILHRQHAVKLLSEDALRMDKLSPALAEVYDLERLLGRLNARLANPRDTLSLGRSLRVLPSVATLLAPLSGSALWSSLQEKLSASAQRLAPLAERILAIQREDAPLSARDGGIFNQGTTPELDRLLTLTEDGQRMLAEMEAREREATQIPSLKVRYNRVFGYYIEVTQAHLKSVPSHYQRKQTTVGAERFFTEELKKLEDELVSATEKRKALELSLFEDLQEEIRAETAAILEAAEALAETDALGSLAQLALQPGWTYPVIDESLQLTILGGRHPLVETSQTGSFVPNDLKLDEQDQRILLITGPNMGGKSTVMRQVALILILGQMGAPIPAQSAQWGAVGSLYTRIGAHDAIARGQSTFMVEMTELAHILHHADDRSFIILDEIGRGTSTYDGMSVAWSTLEWISKEIQCRTLFATHYHELTRLSEELPGVANAHMGVEDTRSAEGGGLRFLYKMLAGPASESFGVHVAKIAGLPARVIDRAWEILRDLEGGSLVGPADLQESERLGQLPLFQIQSKPELTSRPQEKPTPPPVQGLTLQSPAWIQELRAADINGMTPLEALNYLAALREKASGPDFD